MASSFSITFNQTGDFVALYEAERVLQAHGFSVGTIQRGAPTAVMFGDYIVSKWRNLDHDERRETHATLTGNNREGPLVFRLLPAAPDEAVRAAEAIRAEAAQ